ncbi:Serine/threonine-protein kinase Nek1 [Armadillidium nasatum]|uniref:non-specific serine/threonine protein kinase n=1 Tax=Armadillidium nasatum TaxID=96803 RepID=A0A5N5SRB0_9CRUS|nr:Serine/threonine-protein kinase Nek1 [Armadillidium nasatum]
MDYFADMAPPILNLQHQNVTMFHDFFITGSSFCIVTEYCSGGNLKDFICRQNGIFLPEGFILDSFVQLGLAVNFLHEKSIVHRNINSRSVFFSHDGCVKLGNFKNAALLKSSINITNYASPELIQKKPYDIASDIWSLGCVLYEMTCLKHAFEDSNEALLMLKILSSPVEPIPNHYSNDLKALTSLMLEKKSNKRPLIKTLLMFSFLNKRVLKYAKEEEIQDLKIDSKGNVGKLPVLKTSMLNCPLSKYSKSINSLHLVPNISKEKVKKEKENDSVETLNTLTCIKYSKKNSYIFKESARRGRKKSGNIETKNSLESPLLCRPLDKYSKILSNNFTSNEDSITFPRIIPPVTNSYSKKFLKDIFSPLASFSYIPKVNKDKLKCFKDYMSTMSWHKMRKDLDVLSDISAERTIENIFTGFKMDESIFDDIYKRKKIIPESFWTEGKNEINEEINGLLSYSKGPNILPYDISLFTNDHYHMFNEGASKSSDIFKELFMLVRNCLCCTCLNSLLLKHFFSYEFFKHTAVDVNHFDQYKSNNKYLNVDLLYKYLQSKLGFLLKKCTGVGVEIYCYIHEDYEERNKFRSR